MQASPHAKKSNIIFGLFVLLCFIGMGWVMHLSGQAEQREHEQTELRSSRHDGDIAELDFMHELSRKHGYDKNYEPTARDYYNLHQARYNARLKDTTAYPDALRADELDRYNKNRLILGLPPVTSEELYAN